MKVTMYELLGMVKDGKAPLEFKVNDEIYEYDEDRGYICRHIGGWTYLYENLNKGYISLNDEIEIIEEEKKIPKKLETYKEVDDEKHFANILKVSKNGECEIDEATSVIVEKINEIIDYLKSKGDE